MVCHERANPSGRLRSRQSLYLDIVAPSRRWAEARVARGASASKRATRQKINRQVVDAPERQGNQVANAAVARTVGGLDLVPPTLDVQVPAACAWAGGWVDGAPAY